MGSEGARAARASPYEASSDELHKIDEGRVAVRGGEVVTDEDVEAVFAKHRNK
jgi:hypothetical protein